MVTTIQIGEKTMEMLKKLKERHNAQSYDETINKIVIEKTKEKSMGGSLKKYFKNESLKEVLKELQNERRKSNRY
jgi:predicted CopG family antitoxin